MRRSRWKEQTKKFYKDRFIPYIKEEIKGQGELLSLV